MTELSKTIYDIAIIGAGIAGSYCAAQLRQAGFTVAMVEKSRGTGGRASSRRLPVSIDGASAATPPNYSADEIDQLLKTQQSCELGAPFFHQSNDDNYYAKALNKDIEQWLAEGVIGRWPSADSGEQLAYTGLPRMSALTRHLSQHSDLYASHKVAFISREFEEAGVAKQAVSGQAYAKNSAALWCLRDEKYQRLIKARTLIVTAPAEQTSQLLANVSVATKALLAAHTAVAHCQPQWVSAIKIFTKALPSSFAAMIANVPDVLNVDHPVLARIIRDNAKPNRQDAPQCWVLQANLAWSEQNLDLSHEQVSAALLAAFYSVAAEVNQSKEVYLLGNSSTVEHLNNAVVVAAVHRWRLGRHCPNATIQSSPVATQSSPVATADTSTQTPTELMRWDAEQQLGLAADWLADGSIAGAIASARALSREIILALR